MGIFALAIGAAAAMAMSPAPKKAEIKSSATNLHWFKPDGSPDGYMDQPSKQLDCRTPIYECSYGYESLDQNGDPVGTPVIVLGEEQN